jgi:hypothetical protein
VQFLGEPIQWVQTARYLGVTLDTRLTLSAHVNQDSKRAAQRLGMLGPLLNRKSGLSVGSGVLLYKHLIWIMHSRSADPLPAAMAESCNCYNPSAFALLTTHLGTLVTCKAHMAELSASVLKQLKRDIVAEKGRAAEATAKGKGSGERPTGQRSGLQLGSTGEGTSISHKDPEANIGKRKAKELGSSDSAVRWNQSPGALASAWSRVRAPVCRGKGHTRPRPVG